MKNLREAAEEVVRLWDSGQLLEDPNPAIYALKVALEAESVIPTGYPDGLVPD